MDVEQARRYLRGRPHVEETMQWGANLVYWAAPKAIGGKMFALIDLNEDQRREQGRRPVLSFYAGPSAYPELLERDGVIPAPYLARAYWVALVDWEALATAELKLLLEAAHVGVTARLPRKVREMLRSQPAPAAKKSEPTDRKKSNSGYGALRYGAGVS
jgi:predicted DNA-binding protein (MmcQ/YjbR family)